MKQHHDWFPIVPIAVLLVAAFAISYWWFPQKWQACQKLYDNRPAQIFCLLSK